MYDNHIHTPAFRNLRQAIEDMFSGEDTHATPEKLQERIQKAYEDGKLSSTQYDYLMALLD